MADFTESTWHGVALPTQRYEAHFGDRIVRCFSQRPRSLFDMFGQSLARFAARDAIVFEDERWSYAELDAWVTRVASGLTGAGISAGDRVGLYLSNRPEFIVGLLASQRIGAITVPISVREQTPGLSYILNQCGARALIYDAELAERLPAHADCPKLSLRIVVRPIGGAAAPAGATHRFDQLDGSAAKAAIAEVNAEDTAVIMYTSGTTGRPKGAMITHLSIVHSVLHFIFTMRLSEHDRSMMAVPASHVTGLVANIATMIGAGGATIIVPVFKAARFLKQAAAERATHTVMVPAMYNLCLLEPQFGEYDLSAWRVGCYGGAPMPVATIDALAELLPKLTLQNCYGATETTSPATIIPAGRTRDFADSVGLAMPCAELIVVNDDGIELPRGAVGEIWIGGPMVVRGYWDNPQASATEFTAGFWHSGDLGSIDAQGYVRVFDRKKDMLNRGGYKIYSVEVENTLMGVPGVIEAAVIGKPCPVLGERVHACVTTDAGVSADALKQYCAARLADYKVPETYTISRDPLPRNPNGKVLKRLLREQLLAATAAQQGG